MNFRPIMPRGTLSIVAPTTMMFSHQHSTAFELYFDPIEKTANGYTAAIVKALGGARTADLRSILVASDAGAEDLQKAIVAIAGARGAELRGVSADDVARAIEYAGWRNSRSPSESQIAAMLHYFRRCMADRGEAVGELLRPFRADVFASGEFGALTKIVQGA